MRDGSCKVMEQIPPEKRWVKKQAETKEGQLLGFELRILRAHARGAQ